jgi:CRP-like cAMP-binding protein
MQSDTSHFIAALRRIPLFQNLNPQQAMVLLKACERRSYGRSEILCQFGDSSDEMFILLSGELSVRTGEGTQIARITPIAPVGEMGIFTSEPRSATVVVREPATLFVLNKAQLDHLLRRNPDVELIVSRNLIALLSQRIRDTNREIAHLSGLLADQEAGAASLEEPEDDPSVQ